MYDLLWTKKATVHLLLLNKKNSNYLFNRQIFLTKYKLYSWNWEKKEFPEESDTSASLLIDVRTGFFNYCSITFLFLKKCLDTE